MTTLSQVSEVAKCWNRLDDSEKLEIIQYGIDNCDTSEGFLMLRYFRKENEVGAYIQKRLENHLCVEAVSQDTLIELFGENHEYTPEDAEVILEWMNSQK